MEKRGWKFKYPKLALIAIVIILAYFIFSNSYVKNFILSLNNLSYIGVFLGGMLYSYGFTSPIAAGFFIILKPTNLWFAGLIGGFGALLSDLFIFNLVRFELMDEFNLLNKTRVVKNISKGIEKFFGRKIKTVLAYLLAAIFIASPLPDEVGIIMVAGLTKINRYVFMLLSFILNTLGILLLLAL